MSILQQFSYEGRQVRSVAVDGEPWFVAADLLALLDLTRSSIALLDEDERGVHTMDSPSGQQNYSVVSESGMYSLILRSRKPEAKAIKKWITGEVLPAIRKTGSYSVAQEPVLSELEVAERYVASLKRNRELEAQAEADRPMVERAKVHMGGNGLKHRQEFGREVITWAREEHGIEVKHSEVNDFLARKLGLFVQGQRSDTGTATTDAIKRGLAVTTQGTALNGHNYATGKLTPEGQQYAFDRIIRWIDANGTLALPTQIGVAS